MKVKNKNYLRNLNKNLSPETQEKILGIEPGEFFNLINEGSGTVETLRNSVYSFLHHEGLKKEYQIKKLNEITLLVLKKRFGQAVSREIEIESREDASLDYTRIEDLVIENLMDFEQPEEVLAWLSQALIKQRIKQEEFMPVLNEWKRITAP